MQASVFLRGVARFLVLALFVTAMGVCFAAAQDDAIKLGVIMPITGREGKPGQYQKEGIELAIKQINDKGGVQVKGKKLQIKEVFYDDGSDSAKSASLAERAMRSDKVTAVIGGYSTALGEAESVMPDRYQTPWITPGAAAHIHLQQGLQIHIRNTEPGVVARLHDWRVSRQPGGPGQT